MTLYSYTTELNSIVQVCEALDLIVGTIEVEAKVVSEEDKIDMSNPSNANKRKLYIDRDEVIFQSEMHFNGLNNVIYQGLKSEA